MEENNAKFNRKAGGWQGNIFLFVVLLAAVFSLNYFPNPLTVISVILVAILLLLFFLFPRPLIIFLLLIRSSLDITKSYFSVYIFSGLQLTAAIGVSLLLILGGIYYLLSHRVAVLRIPLTKIIIIFLLFSVLNLLLTENIAAGMEELLRFISMFVIYVMVWDLFRTDKQIHCLVNAVLFSALIPIGFGLYQAVLNQGQFITGFIRVYGTFAHPNPFAFYLIIILALTVNLYLHRPPRPVRLRLFLISLAGVFCLLLTFTRTAWFGFLLILLLAAFYRDRRLLWFFVLLIAVFCLLSPIRSRFYDLSTSFNSMNYRFYIWKGGLEQLSAIPILGRGLGSFKLMDKFGDQAHNVYLRVLFELGIVGLAAYLVLIIAVLRRLTAALRGFGARRNYTYALVLAVFSAFFIYQLAAFTGNILYRPAIQWYLWALIAAALKGAEIECEEGEAHFVKRIS